MNRIELPDGIVLDDPRPTAAAAPYTFSMPWAEELAALEPGDGVQAIFREVAGGRHYDAERMWVGIDEISDGWVRGYLDNEPYDMPSIKLHDIVRIPLSHVIAVTYREGKAWPSVPEWRWYWERCMVDDCVLSGRSRIDYLYREEPDMTREGDKYPDSGWRIRGTQAAIEEDEVQGRKPHYIALGKVLNMDDSWINLIDCEYARHFSRDESTGSFEEVF